jgi:uncharacterized membrane protein
MTILTQERSYNRGLSNFCVCVRVKSQRKAKYVNIQIYKLLLYAMQHTGHLCPPIIVVTVFVGLKAMGVNDASPFSPRQHFRDQEMR